MCECDALAPSPRFLRLSAGAGRGRAGAHPLPVPTAGPTASENFTDPESCFPIGNSFGKLCTDAYGIYSSFFSPPLLTLAFAGVALQHARGDVAGKHTGAITRNQNASALFMNCIQIGHHVLIWFAYKLP